MKALSVQLLNRRNLPANCLISQGFRGITFRLGKLRAAIHPLTAKAGSILAVLPNAAWLRPAYFRFFFEVTAAVPPALLSS